VTVQSLGARTPSIAEGAWVSIAAYVVGDVRLGAGSSVWPGAVVRGDFGRIVIGGNTHIEDNAVVHTGDETVIGDNVLVAHAAVVHARSVGDNCLIGNGAILLDDVEVPSLCIVAAGSVVVAGTRIEEGSFLVGTPAKVRPAGPEHLARLRMQSDTTVGYAAMVREYRASPHHDL
jgi:carbonic anhydrase/acetyltransferase-like protein (isoleucine patch superfamily)